MVDQSLEKSFTVCYLLGRALRNGDAEQFLYEYDKCLLLLKEDTANSNQLDNIKELARAVSDLPVHQFSLLEHSYHEGLLQDIPIDSMSLSDVLFRLSSSIGCTTSDSGICSDDNESSKVAKRVDQLAIKDSNTDEHISKERQSTDISGVYIYCNGSVVKVEETIDFHLEKRKKREFTDMHKSYVQFLWNGWCAVQRDLTLAKDDRKFM